MKKVVLKNVRLHRGNDGSKKSTFYWCIKTNKKVSDNMIPKFCFIPEQTFNTK